MKIHFNIEYRTRWGEDLRVQLWVVDKHGQKKAVDELPLGTQDGSMVRRGLWMSCRWGLKMARCGMEI